MRRLSHRTRASFIKEEGYPGFLKPSSISEDIKEAEKNGELEKLKKEVCIDMDLLLE